MIVVFDNFICISSNYNFFLPIKILENSSL